jgi:hypothetical protein
MKLRPAAVQGLASLYHYDRFEDPTRLERIVSESTIYCSNPNDFNDPWDCKPCFSKVLLDDPAKYEATLQWFVGTSKRLDPSIPDAEHARRIAILRVDRQRLEWMIDQATRAMTPAILAQYRGLLPQYPSGRSAYVVTLHALAPRLLLRIFREERAILRSPPCRIP